MKRQISNQMAIAAVLVVLLAGRSAGHQDNNQASTQVASQRVSERFIGVWKLREGKTPHAGSFSELMTIERQGEHYKFTHDQLFGSVQNHLSYTTDMRGEIVTAAQMNGQPIPGKSRITRIDSSSFKVDGEILKDVYKVSSDGQTMKKQRTFFVQAGRPNVLHDSLLVFDRQK